jgi:hypothetical protein
MSEQPGSARQELVALAKSPRFMPPDWTPPLPAINYFLGRRKFQRRQL